MKLLYLFVIFITCTSSPHAQAIKPTSDASEFGDISEVANARKVYVWANDLEARKIIVQELAKNSSLIVVDRLEDAEFALTYGLERERRSWTFFGGGIQSNQRQSADMMALRAASLEGRDRDAVRIVWSTRKLRDYSNGISFNRHPARNGAREFLKALGKAREGGARLDVKPLPPMRSLGTSPDQPEQVEKIVPQGDAALPSSVHLLPTLLHVERAKYTKDARKQMIQGLVVLSAMFTHDGRIEDIQVVVGLPNGLTESAIEATRKIRFTPAQKDGKPVSVRRKVEFKFSL